MLWSSEKLKTILGLTLILLVVNTYQETSAADLNNEELKNIVNQMIAKALTVEKIKFEAKIDNLENEVESLKNQNEIYQKEINKTKISLDNYLHALAEFKFLSDNNTKLIIDGKKDINKSMESLKQEVIQIGKTLQDLDEQKSVGTSCAAIAESGSVKSGIFLLDTDGDGKNAPFKVKLLYDISNLSPSNGA